MHHNADIQARRVNRIGPQTSIANERVADFGNKRPEKACSGCGRVLAEAVEGAGGSIRPPDVLQQREQWRTVGGSERTNGKRSSGHGEGSTFRPRAHELPESLPHNPVVRYARRPQAPRSGAAIWTRVWHHTPSLSLTAQETRVAGRQRGWRQRAQQGQVLYGRPGSPGRHARRHRCWPAHTNAHRLA